MGQVLHQVQQLPQVSFYQSPIEPDHYLIFDLLKIRPCNIEQQVKCIESSDEAVADMKQMAWSLRHVQG